MLSFVLFPSAACGGRIDEPLVPAEKSPTPGPGTPAAPPPSAGPASASSDLSIDADVRGIAVDAGAVYVIDVMGAVTRLDKASHAPVVLATAQVGYVYPGGLVADDTHLYWTVLGLGDADGQVVRMPKGGGPMEILASGRRRSHQLAIDASRVYWADEGASAGLPGDGAIASVAKTGGAVTELATGQPGAIVIATHGDQVYWANRPSGSLNGTVQRVAKSGGPSTLLAEARETIGAIAVTDDRVFWTELPGASGARVVALPSSGGQATDLVGSAGAGSALGVAGSELVFAVRRDATVAVVADATASMTPRDVLTTSYPTAISFFAGSVGTADAAAVYLVDTWFDRASGRPQSVIRTIAP